MNKKVIDQLFSRDGGRCKICGTCVNVGPYLITRASIMPSGGEVIENLITPALKKFLIIVDRIEFH